MRLLPEEKLEIIQMVTRSEIGVNRTLRELGIHKSTFYKWYNLYLECMSSKESVLFLRECFLFQI